MGGYAFEAPAAFLADFLRDVEGFPFDVLRPRVSRRVNGMIFGSWSAAELTTWISQELILSPLAAAATATAL
jgi:hypothetical protein